MVMSVGRPAGKRLIPALGVAAVAACFLPGFVAAPLRAAPQQKAAMPAPMPIVGAIVLSPDGGRYATVTADNSIELRNRNIAPTAPPTLKINGPREPITAIAFAYDGRTIAATTSDKLRVWDTQNGTRLAEVDPPHVNLPSGSDPRLALIAFSRAGNALLVGDSRGFTALAILPSPDNPVFQMAQVYGMAAPFTVLAGNGRGGWFAGDAAGNLYSLGDSSTGRPQWRRVAMTPSPAAGERSPLRALTANEDGTLLATRSADNQIRFWKVSPPTPTGDVSVTLSRQQAADTLTSNLIWETTGDMVTGLSATGQSQTVAAAAPPASPTPPVSSPEVATTAIPTPATPTPATPTPANPANPTATTPAVPPPTTTTTPTTPPPTVPKPAPLAVSQLFKLVGHSEWVNAVAFSPDGQTLASGSRDKTVRLWDTIRGMPKQILGKHDNYVSSLAFSPDGKRLFSGGWDKHIYMWNLETGHKTAEPLLQKHGSYVLSLAYSADGTRLACGGNDRTVHLYLNNLSAAKITDPLPDGIATVAFSPDGNKLAGGCLNGNVYIWDAHTLKPLHRLSPTDGSGAVYCLTWVSNNLVVSSGKGGALHLWNGTTGASAGIAHSGHEDVYGMTFDSKRSLLATGGTDRTIRFWSLVDLKKNDAEIKPVYEQAGHSNTIRCLSFSPDGKRLASGDWDFNIYLWHVEGGASGGEATTAETQQTNQP